MANGVPAVDCVIAVADIFIVADVPSVAGFPADAVDPAKDLLLKTNKQNSLVSVTPETNFLLVLLKPAKNV